MGELMKENRPRILVIFYSMYGHTFRMAKAVVEGVREAGGEPVLKQVAELVPKEYWSKAVKETKELMKDVPIANPRKDLNDIDGIIVGTPTRFGNMCAQMRNFWDQTGGEWANNVLVGKPAAVFTGSDTQHGGQETTIISTHLTLLHHGCVIVGLPYTFEEQRTIEEISGGSPYGASTIAGPKGKLMPSANELKMAKGLGRHLTTIVKKLSA
jgi:NAD(P)H dehydrogenase (quinone)